MPEELIQSVFSIGNATAAAENANKFWFWTAEHVTNTIRNKKLSV